jgi:hypothetical protein
MTEPGYTPVYITRDDQGQHGVLELPTWQASLLVHLAVLNGIGWGIYGLVQLALQVIP